MPLLSFTDNNIKRYKNNGSTIDKVRARDIKYLCLYVNRANNKSFYYRRRINGKETALYIGQYPVTTIEQATLRVQEINADIFKGKEPAKKSDTITLSELFEDYSKAVKGIKASLDQCVCHFKHAKTLHNRPINNITNADIKQCLNALRGHPSSANRLKALLSVLYNHARDNLRIDIQNPCIGIKKLSEEPRSRILSSEELEIFQTVIVDWQSSRLSGISEKNSIHSNNKHNYADLFLMLLLTGQRKANVLQMAWDDISAENIWNIPAEQTKTRRIYRVPLLKESLQILEQRHYLKDKGCKWVFPSPLNNSLPIAEPKRAWELFCKDCKIKGLNIHDLRRSFISLLKNKGVPIKIISELVGHSSISQTERVYSVINKDVQKEELSKLSTSIKIGDIKWDKLKEVAEEFNAITKNTGKGVTQEEFCKMFSKVELKDKDGKPLTDEQIVKLLFSLPN